MYHAYVSTAAFWPLYSYRFFSCMHFFRFFRRPSIPISCVSQNQMINLKTELADSNQSAFQLQLIQISQESFVYGDLFSKLFYTPSNLLPIISTNIIINSYIMLIKRVPLSQWSPIYKFSTFSEGDVQKAQQYVTETLRSRSWVDYMISGYLPKAVRNAYCAIQLFNLEMMRISDNIREPSLGLGKLEFWRTTINNIYNKQKPNAQPISICLHDACHKHPLTKGYFERIINTKSEQLTTRSIDNMAQMLRLCQNSESTLLALNLELLRIEIQPEHEELLTKMGHSIGICNYLRRVPYGLRNYRYFVPLDIMNKYGVQTTKIWDRIRGKPSEDFFDAVLEIAAFSKKSFEESVVIYEKLAKESKIHPQAFRAFLKGVQIQSYLKELQKYNFNLFEPGLYKGSPVALPMKFFNAAKKHRFWSQGKID